MDNGPNSGEDHSGEDNAGEANHDHAARLIDEGLEWARRVRGRAVTVVALEFDGIERLRADLGYAGVADLLDVVTERLSAMQAVTPIRSDDGFILISRAPRSTVDAFSLADRVARALARRHVIGDFEIALAASMGVCQSLNGAGDSQLLLRDAHFALEEAKQRGRGKVVVLSPEFRRRRPNAPLDIRLQFEPVVSLDDGTVSTYDATVLPGPTPGFPDADTATLELLLNELARAIATWPIGVDASFNVSTAQILDDCFPKRVAASADRYSLGHDRFVFQIPARHAAREVLAVQPALARLRDDGWRVGVDEFAAATSLVSALAQLPVEFVRVDQAIGEHVDPSDRNQLSISAAARSLGITTIATGIETLPELALAIAHEYDFAEGPLFEGKLTPPPR